MTAHADASRALPPPRHCGLYHPGHEVHYIQARLSNREGPGVWRTVTSVDHGGTITFAGGDTRWNHDPRRLRAVLERYGGDVRLGSHGMLWAPAGSSSSYGFCVDTGPSPCRGGGTRRPGESLADELLRRGGLVVGGSEALVRAGRGRAKRSTRP